MHSRSNDECNLGIAVGEELEYYSFPSPHPFSRQRVREFYSLLESSGINFVKVSPSIAGEEDLLLFHDKEYVNYVREASIVGDVYLDGGDTPAFRGIYEASLYVVGTTLKLAKMVLDGELTHAFNPVGGLHHSRRDSAAGFCVFNDIAITVEWLRRQGIRRVLYVDIDVHHGDGVFYSYVSDPEIYIFDVHEDGKYIYPGTGGEEETGAGRAKGTKVNLPLPPGSGDDKISKITEMLEEFAARSKPEFIIFQAGADSLRNDLLGDLDFTTRYHSSVASLLNRKSHELCNGRLLALGGGGYNAENCAEAWLEVCRKLVKKDG